MEDNALLREGLVLLLTSAGHEALDLMAEGHDNATIARTLVVSERAVHKRIGNVFRKLGLSQSESGHRRVLAVLTYLNNSWPHVHSGVRRAAARPCQSRAASGCCRTQPAHADAIMSWTSCLAFQSSSVAMRSAEATTRAGSPGRRGVTVGGRS